ncbi:CRTAC1 family protein [Tabrizicola oligotrophica]|nr:CRTAC1 family protein [Tabrizicola oligotrophica]
MLPLLALASPVWADDPALPQYVEETGHGLATPYQGEWQYMVGGGAAVFDCDADARPDVFIAGGEGPAGLYRNVSEPAGPLRFAPVEGLSETAVTGAYPLDIDSDGLTDLAVLRVGENHLMRGLGDCRFENANAAWGFDGGDAWSTAFAATWEAGQDWPTLAVGNYIDRKEEAFPWGSCTDNWLHRPEGRGFAPPLPLTPSFCALSMVFSDWSNSGSRDLRVSNDREYYKGGQEQLWHMEAAPRLWSDKEGWKRLRIWGMGIAARDLDADGFNEFFLTSMADNKLQVLNPPAGKTLPQYADQAFKRGATAHRPFTGGDLRPSTAWHAQFEDVNNDGRADLFVVKGNVHAMPDFAQKDPNNLMLQRADGTFVEAAEVSGALSFANGRGGAVADFNADGKLDLLVVNRWEPPQVWRNSTQDPGGFVTVTLRQAGTNRDAIGAWVEVRTEGGLQRREITVGGGHMSGQLLPWHFGIGAAEMAEVRVIWPDGSASDWVQAQPGTAVLLER